MKKQPLPAPTPQEAEAAVLKTETIHLRVTADQKREISETARSVHRSMTEYLVQCHEVVSEKLKRR